MAIEAWSQADVRFEYPADTDSQIFDPCYGVIETDGSVTVYPGVNGNPAFLPRELDPSDAEVPGKHVFDTKLTRIVMEQVGINANFWRPEKGNWVTE